MLNARSSQYLQNNFLFQVISIDDIPPPIIQIGPTNQTLPKGSVAQLSCRAAGTPSPDIKWFKDGAAIHSKSRFVIVPSGTLKIDGKIFFLWMLFCAKMFSAAEGRQILSLGATPLRFLRNSHEIAVIANLIKAGWHGSNWDVFLILFFRANLHNEHTLYVGILTIHNSQWTFLCSLHGIGNELKLMSVPTIKAWF